MEIIYLYFKLLSLAIFSVVMTARSYLIDEVSTHPIKKVFYDGTYVRGSSKVYDISTAEDLVDFITEFTLKADKEGYSKAQIPLCALKTGVKLEAYIVPDSGILNTAFLRTISMITRKDTLLSVPGDIYFYGKFLKSIPFFPGTEISDFSLHVNKAKFIKDRIVDFDVRLTNGIFADGTINFVSLSKKKLITTTFKFSEPVPVYNKQITVLGKTIVPWKVVGAEVRYLPKQGVSGEVHFVNDKSQKQEMRVFFQQKEKKAHVQFMNPENFTFLPVKEFDIENIGVETVMDFRVLFQVAPSFMELPSNNELLGNVTVIKKKDGEKVESNVVFNVSNIGENVISLEEISQMIDESKKLDKAKVCTFTYESLEREIHHD